MLGFNRFFALLGSLFYIKFYSSYIIGDLNISFGKHILRYRYWSTKDTARSSALLLQSGTENISALVEELGLKSKAVYLPSSITGGKPQALIPLHSNPPYATLAKSYFPSGLSSNTEPTLKKWACSLQLLDQLFSETIASKPDATEADLESTLTSILSGNLNLADNAKVTIDNDIMHVEVSNPRLENKKMWIYESIGTPLASIVASALAQMLNEPIIIEEDQTLKGKTLLKLKLLRRNL